MGLNKTLRTSHNPELVNAGHHHYTTNTPIVSGGGQTRCSVLLGAINIFDYGGKIERGGGLTE